MLILPPSNITSPWKSCPQKLLLIVKSALCKERHSFWAYIVSFSVACFISLHFFSYKMDWMDRRKQRTTYSFFHLLIHLFIRSFIHWTTPTRLDNQHWHQLTRRNSKPLTGSQLLIVNYDHMHASKSCAHFSARFMRAPNFRHILRAPNSPHFVCAPNSWHILRARLNLATFCARA